MDLSEFEHAALVTDMVRVHADLFREAMSAHADMQHTEQSQSQSQSQLNVPATSSRRTSIFEMTSDAGKGHPE